MEPAVLQAQAHLTLSTPIATHQVGGADADFTGFADAHVLSLRVDEFDLRLGLRPT